MPKINSNMLNERLWVYKAANTRDSAGNLISAAYSLRYEHKLYANILQKDSKAVNNNNEFIHEVTTTITLRYHEDILESDILTFKQPSNDEQITSIRRYIQVGAPMHDKRERTILTCKEIIPYGVVENG